MMGQQIAPLDLRSFWTRATDIENAPANVELEQGLLGILLYEVNTFAEVDGVCLPDDFFEPFHGRLFKLIGQRLKAGRLADPVALANAFAIDPAFQDLGGIRYLADLVDRSPPTAHARSIARELRNLALRRQVLEICAKVANRAASDDAATGEELLADVERQILGTRQGKGDVALVAFGEASARVIEAMDNPPAKRALLKVGLAKIDEATGGFEPGDLIVIGARPSMGKSALASCIALNLACDGLGVAELNGEMSIEQMVRRHLTDWAYTKYGDAGPTYRDIRRGVLTESQKRVLRQVDAELRQLPLEMMRRTGLTLSRASALLRRKKMVWADAGIDMVAAIIDHVGLMRPDETGRGRTEDQTNLSMGLKELATDLGLVLFALAQLNRKVEERDDKRPQLSDLRDSGSWEQDADMVIGVYRDAYYARREPEPRRPEKLAEWLQRTSSTTVEAIFLKMREGDVAVAKLFADIGRNAIRDEAPDFVLI